MATRRLYYDDSFLENFEAQVLSCEPTVPRGGNMAPAPTWEVALDRTAFYPTSGGQPHDLGKLGDANVLEVSEAEDEEIVHFVDGPLEKGTVQGCVNWPRRFDHMQQHTGQHLLSAILQERFGLPTVSFHLGSEISSVDLRGPEPSEEILEGAERAANQVIFQDRPIHVRYGTADQLAKLGVRKEVERAGILRAIEIESIDLQPCGGTHVKSTGQIGLVLVLRCSKMRQNWRVEFVCGGRAGRVARQDYLKLRQTAEKLNCATEDVAASVERVLAERDVNHKNSRAALQQLAQVEAVLATQGAMPDSTGLRVVFQVFDGMQAEYLGFFATEVTKTGKTVALLAHAAGGDVFFAQHPETGRDMNALAKRVFARFPGKGGGTRDFARGRLNDPLQGKEAVEFAKELLSVAATQSAQ
jgi:alanyl-tRNA synthetase